MAKLPPLRFTIDVEQEVLFAALMHAGARMSVGVPEPVERKPRIARQAAPLALPPPDKREPNQKGRYHANGSAGLILAAMGRHPNEIHATDDLVAAANGNAGAASVAITKLIKNKEIERVGKGQYRLLNGASKKQSNREFIFDLFKRGAPITTKMIAEHLTKDGRQPKSASPQLANLQVNGLIMRVGAGTYQITEKGKKANGA